MRVTQYFPCRVNASSCGGYSFREIFYRIAKYYQASRHGADIFLALKKRVMAIGKKVASQIPNVVEVYGVGYPFYGNIQAVKRITLELKTKNRGFFDAEEVARKLLPDLDLLVVFRTNFGPYSVTSDTLAACRNAFASEAATCPRHWQRLFVELYREFNLARRAEDPLDEFMQHGRLHLDFMPVPEQIWQSLPNMIVWPDDLLRLPFIRDLVFTCEPVWVERSSSVPLDYRVNYLLRMVDRAGTATSLDLFNRFLAEHPFASWIRSFPETEEHLAGIWRQAVAAAQERGFIEQIDGEQLQLTGGGREKLAACLEARERIYRDGFSLPN